MAPLLAIGDLNLTFPTYSPILFQFLSKLIGELPRNFPWSPSPAKVGNAQYFFFGGKFDWENRFRAWPTGGIVSWKARSERFRGKANFEASLEKTWLGKDKMDTGSEHVEESFTGLDSHMTFGGDASPRYSETEALLIGRIRARAENLFNTHQYHCAEAVLMALNRGFRAGLADHHAVALASGLPVGVGGSGCMCGALSGAILAMGLLLGGEHPHRNRASVRRASAILHDRFKAAHGSTCCRVLTRKAEKAGRARLDRCAAFTGDGAEIAARLALERRPDLLKQADQTYLDRRNSRLTGFLLRVSRLLR